MARFLERFGELPAIQNISNIDFFLQNCYVINDTKI